MRRGDLGASRKRHGAPVPVRHHVAYPHAAAVADHEVRARPVMVPGRFDRIPQRTAENEFRAASVKFEVDKSVNHDRVAEAAVDAGREQHFRRADAPRLTHCRRYRRAVVVVRHRKAEILRFENGARVRPRRGDGDFTGACRIGTKRRRSAILAERNRASRSRRRREKRRRQYKLQHESLVPHCITSHSSVLHCSLNPARVWSVTGSSRSQPSTLTRSAALSAVVMR